MFMCIWAVRIDISAQQAEILNQNAPTCLHSCVVLHEKPAFCEEKPALCEDNSFT